MNKKGMRVETADLSRDSGLFLTFGGLTGSGDPAVPVDAETASIIRAEQNGNWPGRSIAGIVIKDGSNPAAGPRGAD